MPWLCWCLNVVYALLLAAAAPLVLYQRVFCGKVRGGWRQKLLGELPVRAGDRPCVWLHAVSVGEVLQLRTVLDALRAAHPDWQFVITTTTSTGHAVARSHYPHDQVCYFPLDFTWAVRRALRRVRPSAIVLVELELWPNFILAAAAAGVPVALINGRISQRSYRGYQRVRPLLSLVLRRLSTVAVQNEEYAERLRGLGTPADRIHVTGSIKFDRVETDRQNARTLALRDALGVADGETVFVAGSTQAPEEQLALEAWASLREEFPRLRLILVPRHKERFEEVAQLVEALGWPLVRRTQTIAGDAAARATVGAMPVLLLDTLGELAACWGLADIALVGGSLTNRGGQNMIEPAGYGAAVLFGPNTQNFRDVTEALLARDAARVVHDGAELTAMLGRLCRRPEDARALGAAAQAFVSRQHGATRLTIALIEPLVEPVSAARTRRAA